MPVNFWRKPYYTLKFLYYDNINSQYPEIETTMGYWYACRQLLVIAYLCRWEDSFDDYSLPLTQKYFIQKYDDFFKYCRKVFRSGLVYSPKESRYGYLVLGNIGPPPFDLPSAPFPFSDESDEFFAMHRRICGNLNNVDEEYESIRQGLFRLGRFRWFDSPQIMDAVCPSPVPSQNAADSSIQTDQN